MITIEGQQVQVQTHATNKQDAIRQVGQLLVTSGCIEAGYITSMLGREQVANTYLGNGIAIPHGLPEDRDLMLHVPHGGIWVVFIPGVVSNLPLFILSIFFGIVVTAGMLFILKHPIAAEEEEKAAIAVAA